MFLYGGQNIQGEEVGAGGVHVWLYRLTSGVPGVLRVRNLGGGAVERGVGPRGSVAGRKGTDIVVNIRGLPGDPIMTDYDSSISMALIVTRSSILEREGSRGTR